MRQKLRKYFVTGFIVLVPLTVSVKVFVWAVAFMDNILKPAAQKYLGEGYVFGIGIVLLLIITFCVGVVAQNYFGRKLVDLVERLFDRLPFIRVVYSACKQLLEPFSNDRGYSLQQVVLIEYPMKDRYCVGFLANDDAGMRGEEKLVSVFIPSNHLHLGYLVVMPERDVTRLDMSVEEALKMTVSCGIVISKPFRVEPDESIVELAISPGKQKKKAGTVAGSGPIS
ncbi:MAG: DUF502 domain-containing protein [FCB group bacterium]|jgi:uncharacterized membrane protein|nr:DUF502 domain-containing protein [FCB group bacterium]